MARGLILDTTVLIAMERGLLLSTHFGDARPSIAAVTLAELRTGIELDPQSARAADRAEAVERLSEHLDVLDYTESTAMHHARLRAHTIRTGRPRRPLDLIIAAHAAQTGRTLVSRDVRARFGDLPGVLAEEI